MRISARVSSNKAGRPVPLAHQVPARERLDYRHRIYWSQRSKKSADQYNTIAESFDKPCLRRWLEYIGGRVPPNLRYKTSYTPGPFVQNPERYWVLLKGTEEVSCFTNCVEAWLVCLSANYFLSGERWTIFYVDRST